MHRCFRAGTALAAASAVSPTWTPTTRSFVGARASATSTAVLSAEVQLAGASSWRGVPWTAWLKPDEDGNGSRLGVHLAQENISRS